MYIDKHTNMFGYVHFSISDLKKHISIVYNLTVATTMIKNMTFTYLGMFSITQSNTFFVLTLRQSY